MADDLARKIDPRYSHGDLVRVARAQHQAEAEFVQSLLIEEGIPSMVRRSAGFDVPDMLAAGPRDILVPSSGELAAREVLLQAEFLDPQEQAASRPVRNPTRLLVGLLAFVALVGVIAWIGTEIIG
jgi:Putative prokaryotic signal transducing protein